VAPPCRTAGGCCASAPVPNATIAALHNRELKRLTCADLADTDLILAHSDVAPSGHEQVREAFRAAGVVPRIVVRALRQATMLMLVATGAGATFVPASVAAKKIAGIVTRPFLADGLMTMAAYRADNPPGLAMRFLRIAKELVETVA
jgi:DNA-binding transcriptional LysR family regulator